MELSIFPTQLGWLGLLGQSKSVAGICIGHISADGVRQAMVAKRPDLYSIDPKNESNWFPELRQRMTDFSTGIFDDFLDVQLDLKSGTEFQRQVIQATREIPYGETRSYQEVAALAGSRNAARAVGSVMRKNRFAIIVPCHRVVSASGVGGFAAPGGIDLKHRMLELESTATAM